MYRSQYLTLGFELYWHFTVFKQYGEKGQTGQAGNPQVHSVPCICRLERIKVITVLKQDLEVALERKCRSQCPNLSLFP